MKTKPMELLLQSLDHCSFHSEFRLLTWHPRGIFDDFLADSLIHLLEWEEANQETYFNRFMDLSGLHTIHLHIGHVFQTAAHRRGACQPVKSAFYSESVIGLGIARMYQSLMDEAVIEVRAFRERREAAEWLGVPLEVLSPTSTLPMADATSPRCGE